jgi:hypothetical protein
MPQNRNYNARNNFVSTRIRNTIYKLKRLYGGTITVYKQGDKTTDLRTGVITWTGREAYTVNRAIILPVKLTREQTQTISMISSEKGFVYGGTYDHGMRMFYIDPRDLPQGYEIKMDDWVVYNGSKYEIKSVTDNEFDGLWEVQGVELIGVTPEEIFNLTGHDIMDLNQSSSEEV